MKENLTRIFRYVAWGNGRACEGIAQLAEDSVQRAQALKLMGHILGAGELWRTHRLLKQSMPTGGVWPELGLEACRAKNAAEADAWMSYLHTLDDAALSSSVDYTNLSGVASRDSVHDILHHVANHATHHRGQIMQLVRQAGGQPAPTDYIAWVRAAGSNV